MNGDINNDALKAARLAVNTAYLADETQAVQALLTQLADYRAEAACLHAHQLVSRIRNAAQQGLSHTDKQSVIQAFLKEYQLNSEEGTVLMSIAEALLRIPDKATQDRFLTDKLSTADWHQHLHHSNSLLVNLATDALALSGSMEQKQLQLQQQARTEQHPPFHALFESLLLRLGQPIIRVALKQAMHLLGAQFVFAETIEQAAQATQAKHHPHDAEHVPRHSFDMLGEAAVTAPDAERFFTEYQHAIRHLATVSQVTQAESPGFYANASISVKLSALYPRYEPLQYPYAVAALTEKLLQLARQARDAGIAVTVDAEESERLDMTLAIFEAVATHSELKDWPGLGLAVQAYQKRAIHVIRWLGELAKHTRCSIPVRLVKGAYWDSEIKRAQENGLDGYPVFTRKSATDISYLACAQLLLRHPDLFFPQFATHNAHTVAAILQLARNHPGYEFQRLHGMGEALYHTLHASSSQPVYCRVYAPVGGHRDLLPYLVRRLLENGANTSFINQIENPDITVDAVVRDPLATWLEPRHPGIPLPAAIYGDQRRNSQGLNLADAQIRNQIQQRLEQLSGQTHQAAPWIDGRTYAGQVQSITAPYDAQEIVGNVVYGDHTAVHAALDAAQAGFDDWRDQPAEQRAACLFKTADLMEQQRLELVSLCVREGGRTIKDALAEVREAVDFCRYYAANALTLFQHPTQLPGPAGEINQLRHFGRGVFICISPWNFPVAIFTGQIAAALVSGNTVIAKPAERTALTAMACVRIFHQAGIPESVLHFLPGKGAEIGESLIRDARVAGIAFTGSLATAHWINQQLARHAAIVPLIAETGGQNVMIADSSAHKEQLVQDVVVSAFNSAGQRCSALRALFVPEDTFDPIMELLIGALQQLKLGSPVDYATDVGPVINRAAVTQLEAHVDAMRTLQCRVYQLPLPTATCVMQPDSGYFFPPTLIVLDALQQLREEVFGPVLHVIRYAADDLEQVIDAVNATGYGLTLGIHSRIQGTIAEIKKRTRVGNIYINRNMIGAVVGVQPFGGMGLSGTGPKAGGPDYLRRFTVEQTVTDNITAIGGNTGLLARDLQ